MGTFKIEGVTHWSIPVNNLKESEDFYGGLLGLKPVGRLSNNVMSCFNVGDHNILLCEREKPQDSTIVEDRVHHSFTVSPEGFVQACKTLHENNIPVVELEYRARGYFIGRELYFYLRAVIVSRSAIPPGRKECRSRHTRTSSSRKLTTRTR